MSELKHQENLTSDVNHAKLGQSLAEYPRRNWQVNRWLFLILGILSTLTSIGLTTLLASETLNRINNHGRAVILSVVPLPIALYGLLFVFGSVLIILVIVFWQDHISVFTKGLIVRTARRDTTWLYQDTVRFDSYINEINFGGSAVSTQVKIILVSRSDQRWVIRNRYDKMNELIESLRTLILPTLIADGRQRLTHGDTLAFHKHLIAGQHGLQVKNAIIPFTSVEHSFDNKVFSLYDKEDRKSVLFKAKIHQITNLDLLVNLLDDPLVIEG